MNEDRIDRYARGELSPAEARELAQEALNDPELFEELTFAGVAKAALEKPAPAPKVVLFPRRPVIWNVVGATAAAAAVIAGVAVYRNAAVRAPLPKLETILVTKDLGMLPFAPAFRSIEIDSRTPRTEGSVQAVHDGEATIDLGSLDGLQKGDELEVLPAGRVTLTTVFRDRARGTVSGGVRARSKFRVTGAALPRVLMDRAEGLVTRGELDPAREAVREAAPLVEAAHGDLALLAVLEYHAGAVEAAARHYEMAGDPQSWNSLGAIRIMRGDYAGAEAALQKAGATGRNNLGVLAEMRGDRRKAEAYYRDALRELGGDRARIESNLARVQGRR
jgi:tetratricopeptide (TPR) repeat protein